MGNNGAPQPLWRLKIQTDVGNIMHRPILGLALGAGLAALAAPVLAAAPATVHVDEWNKGDGTQGITITPAQIKAGKEHLPASK